MDDVRNMLREFADRSVAGLPPADLEADIARGKRMLRRVRRRRRVTGVLSVAAATAAVVALGGPSNWWRSGETEVATAPSESPAAGATQTPIPSSVSSPLPITPAGPGETMSMFSAEAIRLVANKSVWRDIGCVLAPEGWTAQHPVPAGQVTLTPPRVRTSAESDRLVLRRLTEPRQLREVTVSREAGKVLHLGRLGDRRAGQVKLDTVWLVVELPVADQSWTAAHLREFLSSCTVR